MVDKPQISVIIPAKNSEATIGKCLRSVESQTYLNIEVVVVDRYSSVSTKEIAGKSDAKVIEIKAVMSEARNVGAKKVRGKHSRGFGWS